jgi:dissimilatory sulfite reductase (desulfoviridin) alpha/beta subunit
MKWTPEAEKAVKNVPFFVRKKVRARVEEEAVNRDRERVTLADVKAAQARFLNRTSREIQGYRVEACFGSGGCPNRIFDSAMLVERIEALLKKEDLLGFLQSQVGADLKFHHEFRVALADCPNACSQPQIRDVGVIGAVDPQITEEACTLCEACAEACREEAVRLGDEGPAIDMGLCLSCGQCIEACPTGTLARAEEGYRVLLGGKLGRHPRLALALPGRYTEDQVLAILKDCIALYKARSRGGKRFAEILTEADIERLAQKHPGISA